MDSAGRTNTLGAAWIKILWYVAWPLCSMAIVGTVWRHGGIIRAQSFTGFAIASYLVLTVAPIVALSGEMGSIFLMVASQTASITTVLLLIVSFACVIDLGPIASVWFLTAFAAATEEIVFRVMLPVQISRAITLRSSRLSAVVVALLSQSVFAICHGIQAWNSFYLPTDRFVFLLAAGLFYLEIVSVLGLGFAIGVHTALNLAINGSVGLGVQLSAFTSLTGVLVGIAFASRIRPCGPSLCRKSTTYTSLTIQ